MITDQREKERETAPNEMRSPRGVQVKRPRRLLSTATALAAAISVAALLWNMATKWRIDWPSISKAICQW